MKMKGSGRGRFLIRGWLFDEVEIRLRDEGVFVPRSKKSCGGTKQVTVGAAVGSELHLFLLECSVHVTSQ